MALDLYEDKFPGIEVIKLGIQFPKQIVESFSLKIFKNYEDKTLTTTKPVDIVYIKSYLTVSESWNLLLWFRVTFSI